MLGVVTSVVGNAVVKGVDGQTRQVTVGDEIHEGEVIITASSASVQIDCSSESPFVIAEDTEFLASAECFSFDGDASDNEVADETIAAVAAALQSGSDLLDVLEATAAGGDSGNNGHTFIRLGRIVLALSEGSTTTEEELLAVLEDVLGEADLIEQLPALVSILGEYTIVEGDTSGAFVVLLNQAPERVSSDITVTLNYSGVAQDGTDFNGVTSVVIPAGSNAATFTIDTIDDVLAEGAESFTISIGAIIDTNFVTIDADPDASSVTNAIVDEPTAGPEDTALVSISGEYTITEGDTSGEFTVAVNQAAADVTSDITVALTYSGVAEDGTDFTGVAEVTIAAGSNSTTFTLDTLDDALAEGSESLVISIGDITDTNFEAIAADLAASSVENAIVDDTNPDTPAGPEDTVTISLAGPSDVVEGETTAAYTVNLSQAIPSAEDGGSDIVVTLTYTYTTAEEEDITETATVTVAAGSDSATFTIDTIDDVLAEGAEDFVVSITEANVADSNFEAIAVSETAGSVTTTITDQIGPDTPAGPEDTALVSISGEYTITEGDTSGEFTVAVNQAAADVTSDITVTLTYSGVAEDGTDFTGVAEVTIAAGSNSTTFTLDTLDDALAEGSESLVISIGDITDTNFEAIAADPAASSVENAIVDETDPDAPNPPDTAYELRLFAVVQVEGTDESPEFEYVAANEIAEDGGVGTYVVLAVDENGDPLADADQPGGTVTVNVSAGTDTADREVDYDSAATVAAIVGTTFTIAAIDDVLADTGEVFTLGLGEDWSRASEFEGVAYSGSVTTTIVDETDNDPEVPEDNDSVTLSIAGPASVVEGETTTDYTLSLVDADGNAIVAETDVVVTVTYTGTATDGSDYTSETPITIAAGQSSATFDLATIDDAIADNGETIVLTISTEDDGGFESLSVDSDTVTTTIGDDDIEPPVALDDSAETGVDASVIVNVATNDSDPDGSLDLGSIVITQLPSNGSVVVNDDGTVTYTPNAGYVGPDTFQYTIADNDGAASNVANVAIQVSDGRETAAFTDNWVNGVQYYAYATEEDYLQGNDPVVSGLTGDRLDENGDPIMGSFSWAEGEFVVFKIGDVIAAEFLAEQLTGDILFIHDIAGLALSNTNADQLENTAIFLQALDADLTDGDLTDGLSTNSTSNSDEAFTNGINISEEVRDAFAGYRDPTTGEPLDLQEAGKVMISDALATLGIEFTRQSEVDPNPNDGGGNENVFETQAIEHVTDTVLALADTEEAGERLADDFAFDAREEDIIVAGNGDVIYSSELLDTEDGDPETARISFNAAGLVANATPQQVAIVENMEIEIPEGTEAQITLEDGTTRVVGTVVYDDETREGYIQLEAFVEGVNGEPDRGITNAEITRGLLQSGELSFVYTLWDWTASTSVSINTLDTYRDILSLEGPSEVVEGDTTAEYTLSLTQAIPDAEDGGTDVVVTLTYTYTTAEADDIIETVSVTIPAGSSSATFTIDTVSDAFAEGREDFVVSITEANIQDDNFDLITVSESNSVTTTIVDGGEAFTLALFAVVQVEGTDESPEFEYVKANEVPEEGGVGEYVVLLVDADGRPVTEQPGGTVTVNVGVDTDTADRGVDYASTATVTAAVGTVFTIATIDDSIADNGEFFSLSLAEDWSEAEANPAVSYDANPVSTNIVDETNNDPEVPEDNDSVTLSIAGPASVVEGETTTDYTLSLVDADGNAIVAETDVVVTVTYTGTATDGSDYTSETPITIAAGQSSATFDLATIDDAIADNGETIVLTISTEDDGGFESLSVGSDTVTTTIGDEPTAGPEDTALVSISGEYTITEGDTSGEFTVAVNQAAADVTSDITVALTYSGVAEDGTDFTGVAEVTIAAGSNSTTFTLDTLDDALAEGSESLVISIGDITDTNFEAIAADLAANSVTNAIVDETDPDAPNPPDTAYELRLFAVVQVEGTDESPEFEYVAANEIAEDGGVGTYVVLAVDENGDPLADADQPGGTVTVNVSAGTDTADREVDYDSAATVAAIVGTTFTIAAIDDVLADTGEVFTLGLGEDWSRASEFEGVAYSGSVTTTIVDETDNDPEVPEDNDSVTISLVDLAVDEGSGTASVTATIANAPTDGPVVVTLDNGATITFAVGATSATSTAFAIQGDDVYLDGETLTLNASVTSGGSEFENLTVDATVDVVVSDTIDTVTVDLSATETVAESGTITYTATLTGGVANNDITVTLANGEEITIAAGAASGTVDVAAPVDDAYVTASITNSIASAVETNAGTAGALENLVVAGDTSVSTDVTENDTETAISLVDLAVDEGSGTASVTATIANAPTDGPVVVTLDNGATITFAVGATSATSTAFAIQGDDVYLDGETLTLNASVTSGGSEFENLTVDATVDVVVSDTIDTVTVDLSATETVAESGTITYTATLTGGVANNDITVTLANGEEITIAAGAASGTVDVAAPVDDAYVTASITNSIASAVETNAGTAGALENLVVAGDTSVSTDVTENDTETAISLVDLAVDEGSGTASVTATIANAPTDGPVVVTLDNGATITFAVGATSATSTAFAIQGDDVYLDGETLTLNASVTSGGSEFENLTVDATVDVVVSDTIDTVTVDLSATETVAESGTITYTATLTGGVANNDITVTLANGEEITIAAGAASGTVDVAAPVDDAYVTASITNSIASAVETNAGTAGALENLVVAGDTSVSTDVTENDTETAISLVDLAVDEGSGTASVTATIANAPTDGPVVVTLDNGATITFAVGATSATSTAFAIQGDDVYLDGETLTLNASVTSGGSEFENLTVDATVDVVVSDTIDTVTVDLSATETVAESGTITYTATLTGGVANNDITVTLANGEEITIAAGAASGTVDVAAPVDDAYVTASITNSIASAVETNAGTAGALENLVVAGDTSVSTDVTENDTETAISLVDLAVDEGSGTASVTATIANAPTDGPVVVTLDNGATITFAVGATSATSTAFAIQGDDVYLDGETLTLNASVTSGGSEFENLTVDATVDVVVSDTIDTTTVTLASSDAHQGADITVTASVDNAPQSTDLVITLDNGEQITIAVGQTAGSVTFANPGSSGDTLSYAISGTSGGNYETLDTTDTVEVSVTDPLSASATDILADENDLIDADANNQAYTSQISLSDGDAIASAVIDSSTANNGTWTVSDTGLVTYTLTAAHGHEVGNDANVADNVDSVTITVTDSNGDTAQVTLNVDIIDDTPEFTSVSDGDNDGVVELFAPNTTETHSAQFANWNFGADGTGVANPVLSSVTGSVSVVSSSSTEIVLNLLDDSGNVAGVLTLNADDTDTLQVNEREPETVTVELLTSLAQAGGPVGSVEIVTPEITVVVTGDNGDGTPNDPSNDTVNTSTNGWGVKNQNLDVNESLTFDFHGRAVSDFQFDTTKFTGGGGSSRNLEVEVTYEDGTNAVFTVSSTQDSTIHIAQLPGLDTSQGIQSVTVTNTGRGSLNLNNITVDVESVEPIPDLAFEFTLGAGAIEDLDGDIDSRIFNIQLSGSSDGVFNSGSSAPIAIDLDGDGVEYLNREAGIVFTDEPSGQILNTAWVAPDDGLLVIDADNSGTVDSSSEYVFTEWSDSAQTDLEAIAEVFDTNQDGVLDAQDERFDEFAVWQDADSDGVTDEEELSSLTDLGIESIELTYREGSEERVDGEGDVTVFGQANVNYVDGSTTTAEDVSFAVEAADLLSEEDDLTKLLSDDPASEGIEATGPSRADAAAIDIAQLELTLNFEHNESDSFDQHE